MRYIVGAGGFGREVLDCLLAQGDRLDDVCFLDERAGGSPVRGIEVRQPTDAADGHYVLAIADTAVRRRLARSLPERGLEPFSVRHPHADVAPETVIGQGFVLFARAYISSSVHIGVHVHVNYGATVGHDAVLEDFVTVLPGANISGAVRLATGVTVGANACILPGVTVGADAMVGAGAVVTKDAEPGAVLVGVPARPR